ncbi:hypothetical protein V1282_003544 [Nitrobacteraceae bacterium AZCC 2146]
MSIFSISVAAVATNKKTSQMTATITQFPCRWRKLTITISSTGREIEMWEARIDGRFANISRGGDGLFRWRGYIPVRHRKPQARQMYRPMTPTQESSSLLAAMAAAETLIAS